MFDAVKWPLKYDNMSTVMFFYPAVAAVGYNERTCRQQKLPYRVATYANALVPRAIAMGSLVLAREKPKVVDIMAALEASVAAAKQARSRHPAETAAKKSAAKKQAAVGSSGVRQVRTTRSD